MSSFFCPHLEGCKGICRRLATDCVPGRPGYLLSKNSVFAVAVEQRIHEKQEVKDREQGKP